MQVHRRQTCHLSWPKLFYTLTSHMGAPLIEPIFSCGPSSVPSEITISGCGFYSRAGCKLKQKQRQCVNKTRHGAIRRSCNLIHILLKPYQLHSQLAQPPLPIKLFCITCQDGIGWTSKTVKACKYGIDFGCTFNNSSQCHAWKKRLGPEKTDFKYMILPAKAILTRPRKDLRDTGHTVSLSDV